MSDKNKYMSLHQTIVASLNEERLRNLLGPRFEEIKEQFEEDPFRDYVLEMLQSHDTDRLLERLQDDVFSKLSFEVSIIKQSKGKLVNFNIYVDDSKYFSDILENDKFNELLKYFNYYVSGTERNKIMVEPLRTDIINDYVFNQCGGVAYHVTESKNVNSILKSGLRCKGGSDYRDFPAKIYMFATHNYKNKKALENDLLQLCMSSEHFGTKYEVLKVNLNHLHFINLYKDAAMKMPGVFYILENISGNRISRYKKTVDLLK